MSKEPKIQLIGGLEIASSGLLGEMVTAKEVEQGSAEGGETIQKLLRASVCRIVVEQKICLLSRVVGKSGILAN